jgi:hypothetical protein
MELLNSFGPSLHQYEGVGKILHAKSEGLRRKRTNVSFEGRQLVNGQVVVAWMAPGFMDWLDAETLVGVARQPAAAITVDHLQPIESSFSTPGISSGIAFARQMILEGPLHSKLKPTRLEFSVVNLAFSQSARSAAPLEAQVDGYSLRFSPVSDYEFTSKRLRRASGVAVTATCECERLDKSPANAKKAAEIVDSVCVALSLATGSKVTWINWRTIGLADPGISMHRSSVTKPYGSTVLALGWRLNSTEAIKGWISVKGKDSLRPMIDYFLDAAGPGPYLETRALAAASLLDALTNHYSQQNGFDFLLEDSEWKKVRPAIRKALEKECKSLGVTPLLGANVNALRRRTFEEKLKRLLNDLKLPSAHIGDLVEARNVLVHSGRFLKESQPVNQYHLLLWTAFAVLARLTGYLEEIHGAPS